MVFTSEHAPTFQQLRFDDSYTKGIEPLTDLSSRAGLVSIEANFFFVFVSIDNFNSDEDKFIYTVITVFNSVEVSGLFNSLQAVWTP